MARMRVHELAKELNINNKELVDRILKLGIQVKNHMSTLNEASVQRVRQQFGGVRGEQVEEKRIGRTVIRRRKKHQREEQPPVGAGPEEGAAVVEEVTPPAEEKPSVEAPEEIQVPAQEMSGPLQEEVPAQPEPVPEKTPQSRREASPAPEPQEEAEPVTGPEAVSPEPSEPPEEETPASPAVSASPQETEPVHEEPVSPSSREESAPSGAETVEAEADAGERASEPVPEESEAAVPEDRRGAVEEARPESLEEVGSEAEEAPPAEGEEPKAEQAPSEAAESEGSEASEEEKPKAKKSKKRRRKKARKDEPAKIIKLPDIIPSEPEEEEELPPAVSRMRIKPEEEVSRESSRKKSPKADTGEREVSKGKARGGRRKEVVGKEDLYSPGELAAQAGRKADRGKAKTGPPKRAPKTEAAPPKVGKRKIKIDEAITLANLAKQMGIKAGEVIKRLLDLGVPANINQAVDFDTAALIASEFDFEVERVGFEEENVLQVQEDKPEDLILRPPVITVMGHVDHGKTSLLDAIRDTNVIGGESGGITQHIGAYYVKFKGGDVVFLDTPGHEAFTAMRARGAKVTDIVILVVAADDGVMQQTIEAINHSRAAGVPIIVAVNKIDKANANVERVKRELAEQGLLAEEWGGDVTMVEISAKSRIGIDELLEMALLQAELMELKANPNKMARGRVIEAKLDKGRGALASILIQEGTLHTGDIYVCGLNHGRVRNMFNDRGKPMDEAGPSTPVEVSGFSGVPNAGDDFIVLSDEKQAKQVAEHRIRKQREKDLSKTSKVSLESLFQQIQEGEIKEVNVILKTDVQGSLEAITEALGKLVSSEVKVNLIHSGTGAITETDIMLASASNAVVIGFNVRADSKVQELAHQESVDIRYYDVIYQLINDVKDAMAGMLEPVYQENVIGHAEVRQTFHITKVGTVAGCYVLDGRVDRKSRVRLLRDQVVVHDGRIQALKRFKDDVKEVKAGFECGMSIENFNDIKVGDVLEAYELEEKKAELKIEE